MSDQVNAAGGPLLEGIKANAPLTIASGAILAVAGTFAILSPLVAGLSITIMVGALLALGGISQCFLAFRAGALGRGVLMLLIGLLMTSTGFYMMTQPVAGLASITLFLVAYFVVTGIVETVTALQLKPHQGWSWQLTNGIITLLLGIMLWRQFPLSGTWALGVLFGIKMVFSGWALIFIGRKVKALAISELST
jgi:uncharacterized membrane protein HdeD (DUF308 family)